MIGGVAARYMGGRFTTAQSTSVGFSLSSSGVTTLAALGSAPITTSVSGWTTPVTVQEDDAYTTVSLPFTVVLTPYNNYSFSTVYLTSNQYIMLGTLATVEYIGLSKSKPMVPKLLLNAADTSWNRVYLKTSSKAVTARIQGVNSAGAGSTVVYEVTFFNSQHFSPSMKASNWVDAIQVVVGEYSASTTVNDSSTSQGIYEANGLLTAYLLPGAETTSTDRQARMITGKNYLYLRHPINGWRIQTDVYLQNKAAYDAGEYAYV